MSNVDFGRYKRIVQYFWDPEPQNDDVLNSPIWCLGTKYDSRLNAGREGTPAPCVTADTPSHIAGSSEQASTGSMTSVEKVDDKSVHRGWSETFLDDFESRFWFTYRSGFPEIKKSLDPQALQAVTFSVRVRSQLMNQSGFTSDTGWGCMIRSGQSLLANALLILRLGREWRRGTRADEEKNLLALFADDARAPFSIHRFVAHGASACGKHPGEWFGPSATARCIQALSNDHTNSGLSVYINGDGADVYEDSFLKIATATGAFTPTLILVGIRLGIDRVTQVYWEALKASLRLPQSVGIAGGRPSSSHYFVATQGDKFFFLDPHQTRAALPLYSDTADYTQDQVDSCHTRRLRRLSINEMDPSMLLGFLIRDREDWKSWRQAIADMEGKPVIHIADAEPVVNHDEGRESAVDEVEVFDDDEF